MFSLKSRETEESVMDQLLSEQEDSDASDDSPPPPGETPRQRLLRKARVSAKRRRDAEDGAMKVLAEALPGRTDLTVSLDKATVIRMAIAFLRLKNYFSSAADAIEDAPAAVKQEEASDLELYTNGVPEAETMLNSFDGFLLMVARDGKIIYVSDTVVDYLGMLPHQMIGKQILEFVHDDDAKEMESQLGWCVRAPSPDDDPTDCLPHESALGESSKLEVDFYVRMKSHLTKNKKRTKQILYTVVHLQGRLVMELAEFNKKLLRGTHMTCLCRTMRASIELEISSEGTMFMSRHTMDMKFTFCDERVSNLIGYDPIEMIGKKAFDFHNPLDSFKISSCHSNLKVKGTSVSKYYRFLGKSGDWVWVQTKATIVYDQNNKPLYVVCMNYVISPEAGRKALLDENPESPQSPDCRGVTTFTDTSFSRPPSVSSASSANSIPSSPKPKRRRHTVEAEGSVPTPLPMATDVKTETRVVSPDTQTMSPKTRIFPSDAQVIPSEAKMMANESQLMSADNRMISAATPVIPPETRVVVSQPGIWPGCRCGQHRTKEECDISGNHCHIFDKWLDGLDELPSDMTAGGLIDYSQLNFELEFTKNTTVQEMLGKIMQMGGSTMPVLENSCGGPEPPSAPTMRQEIPPASLNTRIPVPLRTIQKTPQQAAEKPWSLRDALLAPNSPAAREEFDHRSDFSSSSESSPRQLNGNYDSDYRDKRVVPVVADTIFPVGHQSYSPVSYNGHQSTSPVRHNSYQFGSPVSHNGHQSGSPVSYNGHQSTSPVRHNGHQSGSPVSYNGFQSSSPVSHNGHQARVFRHNGFRSNFPVKGHQLNRVSEEALLGQQAHKGWNHGYNLSPPVGRSADSLRLQQPNAVWGTACDPQSSVEGIADLPARDVSVCGTSQRDKNTWEPTYRPAQAPLRCAEVSSTTNETHQQRLSNSWNLVDKPLRASTSEHTCENVSSPQFRNNLTSCGSTMRPSVNSLSGCRDASQQLDGLWESTLPHSPDDDIFVGADGVTSDILDDLLLHLSSSSKTTCMK